ncbi:purine-binding chemotaxis protein CheW [Caldichromatium japonicum]|uniref:Purine-binding chemotaxis protein CheW n=1 Tax=Caldichromatium japonicum TaxID=2699430 RepID=A0A6G7VC91_9GAMM|nr:chemotaxis protein CheW [Caldichromatium japonicum]QIK37495.1 purine-binding chemotaxis protein CheW [Caldichromatium japonicum]
MMAELASTRDPLELILDQQRLAEREETSETIPSIQLVIFALGDRIQALPGPQVREILPPSTIYPVPGCPPAFAGVMRVRGEILPMIRLSELLQIKPAQPSHPGVILRIQGSRQIEGQPLQGGLSVDRVLDVLDLPAEQLRPPPETLAEPLRHCARAVLPIADQTAILLETDALFDIALCEMGPAR